MSASPSEDAVAYSCADFGLNRGRRLLAFLLVAGLVVWAGRALFLAHQNSSAVQVSEAAPPATVAPAAKVAKRPAQSKRRSKSARVGPPGTVRAPAREPALSAPPLVVAAVDPVEKVLEVAPVEQVPEQVEVAAAAPDSAAPEPVHAVPVELADDGNGEAIGRAIAADKRGAVQACFERELKQTPTLTGTVTVELDLAPPHRVNAVRVTDDLERPAFTQCISSSMEQLRFAALNEEVSVRVPYVLTARAK